MSVIAPQSTMVLKKSIPIDISFDVWLLQNV